MKRSLLVGIGTLLAVAGIGIGVRAAQPDYCGFVSREVGGCDRNQPTFTASTCEGLAEEFGTQLNDRLLAIVNNPPPRDLTHATKASMDRGLVTIRMNQHMQRIRLTCDPRQMLEDVEPHLSVEFRRKAPDYIDDGDTAYDWDHYRKELLDSLKLIQWEKG